MKTFLRHNVNGLLIALAVIFSGIIAGFFIWGIGYLVMEVGQASTSSTTNSQVPGFDLKGAAGLDYRGIAPHVTATSS